MRATSPKTRPGFTLIELLVSVAISGILIVFIALTFVSFDKTAGKRQKINSVLGEGRAGTGYLENWVRGASLLASNGTVSCLLPGGVAGTRPTVEVYKNVLGTGFIDVKPGTDVLLVVGGSGKRASVVGPVYQSLSAIPVTDITQFAANQPVIVSDYQKAAFDVTATVSPGVLPAGQLTLTSAVDIFPQNPAFLQTQGGGLLVSVATSRLIYVDTNDDLVEWTLKVPRMPQTLAEGLSRQKMARGFENLQLEVDLDTGTGLIQSVNRYGPGDPITGEATAALGGFAVGGGPVLETIDMPNLRTVTMAAALRSPTPIADGLGGDAIPLIDGVQLNPATTTLVPAPTAQTPFVRRSYRLANATRNVGLSIY